MKVCGQAVHAAGNTDTITAIVFILLSDWPRTGSVINQSHPDVYGNKLLKEKNQIKLKLIKYNIKLRLLTVFK